MGGYEEEDIFFLFPLSFKNDLNNFYFENKF